MSEEKITAPATVVTAGVSVRDFVRLADTLLRRSDSLKLSSAQECLVVMLKKFKRNVDAVEAKRPAVSTEDVVANLVRAVRESSDMSLLHITLLDSLTQDLSPESELVKIKDKARKVIFDHSL